MQREGSPNIATREVKPLFLCQGRKGSSRANHSRNILSSSYCIPGTAPSVQPKGIRLSVCPKSTHIFFSTKQV